MVLLDAVTLDPFAIVQTGGVVALLLLIIVGGYRGIWVWGWQYRALEKEKDKWEALALRSTNLAESISKLQSRGSR